MSLNYIYDKKGKAEYVVLPIKYWQYIKKIISTEENEDKPDRKFNPNDYYGVISNLNLDVEEEIKNIRKEWSRNI